MREAGRDSGADGKRGSGESVGVRGPGWSRWRWSAEVLVDGRAAAGPEPPRMGGDKLVVAEQLHGGSRWPAATGAGVPGGSWRSSRPSRTARGSRGAASPAPTRRVRVDEGSGRWNSLAVSTKRVRGRWWVVRGIPVKVVADSGAKLDTDSGQSGHLVGAKRRGRVIMARGGWSGSTSLVVFASILLNCTGIPGAVQ